MKEETRCVFCNQTKDSIKANKLYCAGVDSYTGECTWERDRHRFKPFSEKELEAQAKDEAEYIKQMGEFADFVRNNGEITNF